MRHDQELIPAIYEGWHAYQQLLIRALDPFSPDQVELRAAPKLRSVGQIARHIIGARARWFYQLMGEGGKAFKSWGNWDRRGAKERSAEEIVNGLEGTWNGMQEAISNWTAEDWRKTWPGEGGGEPEVITRQWVIWHLIEHDLHHGGEISITLGAHGLTGLNL